jgi:hypothetical protein
VAGAIALFDLVATVPSLIGSFRIPAPDPVANVFGSLRSFNGYGLFRVMTTERPEIIVEGSNDGVNWRAYEFRWKPGDIYRRPGFVAPHQPRLDWQMWFAALENVRANPWFVRFLVRLLEGSPEVLSLVEKSPFPGRPAEVLFARKFTITTYQMGRPDSGLVEAGNPREYCPPISLRDVRQAPENSP